jgi:DNA-binding Lrp family transcriptional regulator
MLAPGWMLGVIEGNSAGVTGWDIADVFPGGAGNWGGSFLTVPAQSKHAEEAKKLAAWLTAPEQQIAAYKSKGTFPSQAEEALRQFEDAMKGLPEVRECHMLNGEIDFILKIVSKDLQSFQEFLTSKLTPAPNVASVKTSLTIRTAKSEPGVPLE